MWVPYKRHEELRAQHAFEKVELQGQVDAMKKEKDERPKLGIKKNSSSLTGCDRGAKKLL
jgi:hypothetical protein